MRIFRLFGFSDGKITVITRGVTEAQALEYATRPDGAFRRGVTVFPLNHLPINASRLYDINHEPGWLYRAPLWLRKKEQQEAIAKGSQTILNEIKELLK